MLDIQFGLKEEAAMIERAVETALEQKIGTPDLFPKAPVSTEKAGQWIADFVNKAGN